MISLRTSVSNLRQGVTHLSVYISVIIVMETPITNYDRAQMRGI
jgi:hypothetical protein